MTTQAISSTFNNAEGSVPEMIVRVVGKGGTYGLNGVHTHRSEEPLVEFYDPSRRETPLENGLAGQFLTSYRMSALDGYTGSLNVGKGVVVSDYGFSEAMRSVRRAAEELRNDDMSMAM